MPVSSSFSISLSTFYSFFLYADPRDLHSFPTRRSSDLHYRIRRTGNCRRRPGAGAREGHTGHRIERRRRSEEHTAELQSSQYLVCRLLHEKKIVDVNRPIVILSRVCLFNSLSSHYTTP